MGKKNLQVTVQLAIDDFNQHFQYFDTFYKKHILNEDNTLVITLKFHLFAEEQLNRIIKMAFPNPSAVLKDRTPFAIKLNLFRSIARPRDIIAINQLEGLGKIRNKFAHNMEFDFLNSNNQDFLDAFNKLRESLPKNLQSATKNRLDILRSALHGLCGHLSSVISQLRIAPLTYLLQSGEHLKKDRLINVKDIYPVTEMKAISSAIKKYANPRK